MGRHRLRCLRLGFKTRDPDHSGPEMNLYDGLRSNSCRAGCQRAVAGGGPISDAPSVAERGAGSALGRPVRLSLGRDRPAAQKPDTVARGDSASGER